MPIHYKKIINKQRNNINNKYYNKSSKVLILVLVLVFRSRAPPLSTAITGSAGEGGRKQEV